MNIQEIFIKETLDNPLPYKKISSSRYVITLGKHNKILVLIYQKLIDGIKCLTISFINPNNDNHESVTNFFNGPSAVRVFSTIIEILSNYNYDLLVAVPDDINIEVQNKKARLYSIVLTRLQKQGTLLANEQVQIPNFHKPIIVGIKTTKAFGLSDQEIQDIVISFGLSKQV